MISIFAIFGILLYANYYLSFEKTMIETDT